MHGDPLLVEVDKGVACAVTERQHHVLALQGVGVLSLQVLDAQTFEQASVSVDAAFEFQRLQALFKADFTTQGHDLLSKVLHHFDQFEGANVGVSHHQNFFRGTRFDEFAHDLAPQKSGVFDL